MKLISKFKYLHVFILTLFAVFFVFFRPRPKLKSLLIKGSNTELSNQNTKMNIYKVIPPTNKISVGKSFLLKDNENWYQIIQLSFWREDYLNLEFLNKQLNIKDINIQSIKSNNYALGTFHGEEIAFSCMKNSDEFQYSSIWGKVPESLDIFHWKKVYIYNLNLLFYSFKPRNYECYVVITPNTNFFKNSRFEINKKIFNNFIYE